MRGRMHGPRVTVVMGVYNCVDTLEGALESLLAQTHQNWNLVVCDDASSDGTYQRLLHWQEIHPTRLKVLRNDVNRKLSYTLNRCLREATGEFVARMDGDDLSAPERFERQVAYLLAHPGVDLVGTAMQRFNEHGFAEIIMPAARPDEKALRSGTPFCHATVMARRAAFEKLDGYADLPRTERAEDIDLWFRFYSEGLVGHNLSDPLYFVRENLSAIRRRTVKNRLNVFRTTIWGYALLNFPRRWYVYPCIGLGKALIPGRAMLAYRWYQKRLRSKTQFT